MKEKNRIVPINRVETTERYILVPRMEKGRLIKKVKPLKKKRGQCYFSQGICLAMTDFIYRCVVKLGLGKTKLIISRGSVKRKYIPVITSVDIWELEWDLGISLIIPMQLNYRKHVSLLIDGTPHELRLMEIITLAGLLRIAFPAKPVKWHSAMAASVISKGWNSIEGKTPPSVFLA